MNEEVYFRQFRGDPMNVTAYFLFCDGDAFLGTTDKELSEKKLAEMSQRFPAFQWEIKIAQLPEEHPVVQYATII